MSGIRQDFRHLGPLLVRPGEPKVPLSLRADARLIAEAAAGAAICGVPLDVALWTVAESLRIAGEDGGTTCGRVPIELTPVPKTSLPNGMSAWLRQLRVGCGYCEDSLPITWAPARLRLDSGSPVWGQAAALAADTARLRSVLDAECAAAAAGLTLTLAIAQVSRQAGTRPPAQASGSAR